MMINSKFRSNSRSHHPEVVQPRGRLGVFTYNQKKNNVLRLTPQKQKPDNNNNNNNNDIDTEKQPISDFPSPPIPIFSCYRSQQGEMPTIPNLATAAHGEITSIVLQKMKLCQRTCDFSDPRADLGGKATKKATLNELIDLYTNQKLLSKLTRECHQQLIETFSANVFRSPPRIPRTIISSDEVPFEDNAWPHLYLVYILFIKFLNCGVEQRILQYQLTPKFISNLFSVLDFPDERERVQVRAVIATIYNKVPPQRTLLMSITLNLLMNVSENLELNAASHLLELFYQFASNSPPPLSQQYIAAFEQVLLPLHLSTICQRYFPSLVKCILLMIRKDVRLTNNVLHYLIEHWPLTLDHKTELFLEEISQILLESNLQDISSLASSLLNCVSIAVESPCTTLSEKALKFLQNNSIQNMIVEDPDPLLEIIFPPLFRVTCSHWQKTLQVAALNVMNTLMELTPDAFKKAAEQFKTNSLLTKKNKIHKYNLWIDVLEAGAMNDSSIDIDVVAEGIKEFYSSDKRPPSRISSNSSTNMNSSRSNNNNSNATTGRNNENLVGSSRSIENGQIGSSRSIGSNNVNTGRSNGNSNVNSGRENNNCNNSVGGSTVSNVANPNDEKKNDKFENFSNPFKDLARDFSCTDYGGLFQLAGISPKSEYPSGNMPTLTVSEETKKFAQNVNNNKLNTGGSLINDQNKNNNQPDMLSLFGGGDNNSNQPDMFSLFEEARKGKAQDNPIIEEENANKEQNTDQPNMFSIIEESKNSDTSNTNAIIEEENNIPNINSIVEENKTDNQDRTIPIMQPIIDEESPNKSEENLKINPITEEENEKQNSNTLINDIIIEEEVEFDDYNSEEEE
ncbi:hypothetical protein M9Y10_005334 [Tritrichomonas musculus]|uniref:Uncharacterized protein n=1 Tax=Tritrichomonas musculus TaxID=1915356 RepID=A0ABR2JKV8_9EUKA